MSFKPFAEGPDRPKQVISLGFYRTGSHSLRHALTILGYQDVFHSSAMAKDTDRWVGLGAAADDNIPCLPTYTGRTWTRKDWNAYVGPCEALTDIAPFAYPLLREFPEAKVILVQRDFDSWARSFEQTLILPSSQTFLAWLSGNIMEPFIGIQISQTAWKMYMGLLGVCSMEKTKDRKIMRAAYQRHYDQVRSLVTSDRLLEIDLGDLGWEPLCNFLGKSIPDVPFPRLNESRVFRDELRRLHWISLRAGGLKALAPAFGVLCVLLAFRLLWS
ncbi:P-loop containing nucleoside triphosphate hydrolase protein [Penicillium maclennaniae]|uniref:P-loop containing nucleoside triphosphate hydrolase protein n=1 Tax=Penicillium maclennaniae TaxID=1343394 RepID=UPI0025424618|nr:P-loop containing nucleoside triphosphate hydrolase protein [Penicillium maclennaniae]KAJ5678047.1 P-loop containing nucleoside triphosphate hydrolase protein [Penicillium maclennaniae]